MGQLVTFQCPGCFRYWVLAKDALEPITVFRAAPQGAAVEAGAGDSIYLPFWVAEVDGAGLKTQIENAVKELQGASQAVIQTGFAGGTVVKLPASSETAYLAARLASLGTMMVYVPAFKSLNTYAYLKVGRLLTRIQPSFALARSDGAGHPVLCALRAEEAVALIDFIFFATLPDAIQSNGDFLQRIHLAPARPPRLVEFPFKTRGASLVSIIGGFWISGRLVEGVESLVH
ncbi:MAG TPA: hypothetical protein VMT60_04015 [Candidatus Bathyarchaeia archaeon]|nr:hypothetical protein [Candidatus Bathyarchaeia archaeon]